MRPTAFAGCDLLQPSFLAVFLPHFIFMSIAAVLLYFSIATPMYFIYFHPRAGRSIGPNGWKCNPKQLRREITSSLSTTVSHGCESLFASYLFTVFCLQFSAA